MARVFISDSHKDEARKDRRTAAREQTHIPRSPLTRTGLSRDRNEPAKARTLIAPYEYFPSLAELQHPQTAVHATRTHHEPKPHPESSGCSAPY